MDRLQLRHAMREVVGLSKADAEEYGVSSLRSGGDTFLEQQGVPKEARMVAGHWATGSVEARYLRITALQHAQRRLAANCAV